jgi:hypothetical protein
MRIPALPVLASLCLLTLPAVSRAEDDAGKKGNTERVTCSVDTKKGDRLAQGKVDAMPQAVAMSLLMLAGLKRDMITSAEQFLGDNYLPQRYKLPAFTMQPLASPTSPIVLTGLAAAWVNPEPETR